MRKVPFAEALIQSNEKVNTISFEKSVVDLSERLKSKQIDDVEEVVSSVTENNSVVWDVFDESEKDSNETVDSSSSDDSADSAEFDDFNKFKEVAETKLGDFMDNPEQFTEILLKFGDLIRTFFYPGIYSKIIFNSQEKIDCEIMLRNRASAMSKNEEYEMNNYELELWGKVQKLNEHKAKIPFTESEIKWLAKIVSKRIESVGIAVMMEKYDWVLALLYIEGKRFLPVSQDRVANLFFSSMNK